MTTMLVPPADRRIQNYLSTRKLSTSDFGRALGSIATSRHLLHVVPSGMPTEPVVGQGPGENRYVPGVEPRAGLPLRLNCTCRPSERHHGFWDVYPWRPLVHHISGRSDRPPFAGRPRESADDHGSADMSVSFSIFDPGPPDVKRHDHHRLRAVSMTARRCATWIADRPEPAEDVAVLPAGFVRTNAHWLI